MGASVVDRVQDTTAAHMLNYQLKTAYKSEVWRHHQQHASERGHYDARQIRTVYCAETGKGTLKSIEHLLKRIKGISCTAGLQFNLGIQLLYSTLFPYGHNQYNKAVLHTWVHAAVQHFNHS